MYLVYVKRKETGAVYGYFAWPKRTGPKVKQIKRYYGMLTPGGHENERVSLKDIIWFLKGSEGIAWLREEERIKYYRSSGLSQLKPRDRRDDWSYTTSCLRENTKFTRISKTCKITIEPNEYFVGRPEDYERAREFLKEDSETQMRNKWEIVT